MKRNTHQRNNNKYFENFLISFFFLIVIRDIFFTFLFYKIHTKHYYKF